MSDFASALAFVKMVIMITIWDDVGVERAQHEHEVIPPCRAFAGERVDSACVWVQAFKHIGDAYERCFFILFLLL